jgi:hypothetical protein
LSKPKLIKSCRAEEEEEEEILNMDIIFVPHILNADNKMSIEIAERTGKGNKAYYANAKLIKSKF